MTRLASFSMAWLVCAACGTRGPVPEPPPQAAVEEPAEVYRHPPSGMAFPVALATLQRDSVVAHDTSGDDVSVGYHRQDADVTVVVTVFIYPRRTPISAEFAGAKRAIEETNEGAKLIAEGPIELEQRGTVHTGTRAHYLFRDPNGQKSPQISHLFLFDHGPWRVKYRVSFLAHQHELADELVMRFMRLLPWPELPSGPIALVQRPAK